MTDAAVGEAERGGRGPVLMTACMLAFTLNDVCMKGVSDELPPMQALFLRGLVTVVALGLLGWRTGALRLPAARADRGWLALRSLAEVGAAGFFVTALFHMPLANVTAILQAIPLTVTAAAALVLRERVDRRRWTAVAIGLMGVLLIVRPGTEGFDANSLYALAAVLSVAVRDIATRRMSREVPSMTVALAAAVGVTTVAAMALPGVDPAPVGWASAARLLASASFVVAGYLLSVAVMRAGEVSLTAPFRYTGLVWALLAGLVFFDEWPRTPTLLGAAVVVAAGLFTLRREDALGAAPHRGLRPR